MFMVQQSVNNNVTVTGHCMRNSKLSAKGHKTLLLRNFPAALAEYYIFCAEHATINKILQTCCSVTGQPDTKMCEEEGGIATVRNWSKKKKKKLPNSITSSINTFSKCLRTRHSFPGNLINVAAN